MAKPKTPTPPPPPPANSWRSRIEGQGHEAPDQLLANPKNWRIHPAAQGEALEAVLDRVGWVQQVIVNKRTGFLVDGHLRVMRALRRGEASIPVLYVDLDLEEEAIILASLDPLSAVARTDQSLLEALIGEIGERDVDTAIMLRQLAEDAKALPLSSLDNPQDHWSGMPEFEQPEAGPLRQCLVSFATEEDRLAFFTLVGQNCTPKTKSIWYPEVERADAIATNYFPK